MDDNIIQDDRRSLLAAFARAPEKAPASAALVAMTPASPADRVVGAQQVAVYRDEQKILEKIKVLASAAGSDWYYRYPVKNNKGGGQDWIEGPSIKLANDIARLYGNCEIDSRVMDLGDSWLIYARFTDFETGFTMTRPFQQRKGQRGMRTESDRALDINLQIGASKAIRNVICNSLQSIADFAYEEARNALVEKIGKQLDTYRQRCADRLREMQIYLPRAEHVIGRPAAKWTAPDVAKVIAMIQSINDGMTTAEEAFPPTPATPATPELASNVRRTTTPDADTGERQEPEPAETPDKAAATTGSAPGTPERLAAAWQRGSDDRRQGAQKRAVPGEFRGPERSAEALAWVRGWNGDPLDENVKPLE